MQSSGDSAPLGSNDTGQVRPWADAVELLGIVGEESGTTMNRKVSHAARKSEVLAMIDRRGAVPTCDMTLAQHRMASRLEVKKLLKKEPGPHPDGDGALTMYYSRRA